MKDWENIYKKNGMVQVDPSPYVVDAIKFFKDKKLIKILDLGCGTGRHISYLKFNGFKVWGCDKSDHALDIALKDTPEAQLDYCDFKVLPYPDNFFEGIISHGVIHHARVNEIKKAISEIHRVLKVDGFVYILVPSIEHEEFSTGNSIENNTKININAIDGDLPHHYFTKKELEEFFKDFKIIKLEHVIYPSEKNPDKTAAGFFLYAKKWRKF